MKTTPPPTNTPNDPVLAGILEQLRTHGIVAPELTPAAYRNLEELRTTGLFGTSVEAVADGILRAGLRGLELEGWCGTIRRFEPQCRECGCTETRACEGGCSWIEPDLCSACASPAPAPAKAKAKRAKKGRKR